MPVNNLILITLEISQQFFEKKSTQIPNFMKIRPAGSDFFFRAEETLTYMVKLTAAIRHYTIVPNTG